MSPSLFTTPNSVEIVSVACSRFSPTKRSIFSSILVRVASVQSPTKRYASCSTYSFLISSYLHLLINRYSTWARGLAYWDANLQNDSSTMSHFGSSPRIQFRARVFNAGTSCCSGGLSDARRVKQNTVEDTDLIRESVYGFWRRPISALRDLRFCSDPNGANSISSV